MTSIAHIQSLLKDGDYPTAKSYARAYLAQHPHIDAVERQTLQSIVERCDRRLTAELEHEVSASRHTP